MSEDENDPALLIGRFKCPECGHLPDHYQRAPDPGEVIDYECEECGLTGEIEHEIDDDTEGAESWP